MEAMNTKEGERDIGVRRRRRGRQSEEGEAEMIQSLFIGLLSEIPMRMPTKSGGVGSWQIQVGKKIQFGQLEEKKKRNKETHMKKPQIELKMFFKNIIHRLYFSDQI